MSANREEIHNNLIDGPDDDYSGPELRYSVLQNPGKHRKRFCQEPFKVATACLTAFCLILLLILVVTGLHAGKTSSSGQDSSSSAAAAHQQTGSINVKALTAELQTAKKEKSELEEKKSELEKEKSELEKKKSELEKEKSELQKELLQLKDKITKLEATPGSRITPAPTTSPCPQNWKHFNGSCYFISVTTRSWTDSQTYCKRYGGHLAIILTAEEQTFIWDLLPRGYWNAYWFGISDEKVEDDWHWVDGTKLVGGFWEDGEPNNHINEDCGYMIKTDVLTRVAIRSWYDAPCYMSLPWICEKPASS
ncbi:CD209 antigen-like protein C [Danio aesculapii]|uniref:CD209 antigen-like protein C n=1 Tax=Danio aesculapii TaxID=1142201 RepID=UPI0024BF9FC3|nr:CD209 antigen-like protein C [Danio aesculapii]